MALPDNNHNGTFQGPTNYQHNRKTWAQTVSGGATKTSSISINSAPLPGDEPGTLPPSADGQSPVDHFSTKIARPYLKGAVAHSMFIDITNVEDPQKKAFLTAFKIFCGGQQFFWSVRDQIRRDYDRYYAEVVIAPYFQKKPCFLPSRFSDAFTAYPSLSPFDDIIKISFTGLPDQYGRLNGGKEQLTTDTENNLRDYGELMDCGFVTGASGLYSGGGYTVLLVSKNQNTQTPHTFKKLIYKLNWNYLPPDFSTETDKLSTISGAFNVLATWAKMPPYCRYCHASDHSMKDCTLRMRSIVCKLCQEPGHIRRNCGRKNGSPSDHAWVAKPAKPAAPSHPSDLSFTCVRSQTKSKIDTSNGAAEAEPSVTDLTQPSASPPLVDTTTPVCRDCKLPGNKVKANKKCILNPKNPLFQEPSPTDPSPSTIDEEPSDDVPHPEDMDTAL